MTNELWRMSAVEAVARLGNKRSRRLSSPKPKRLRHQPGLCWVPRGDDGIPVEEVCPQEMLRAQFRGAKFYETPQGLHSRQDA